MSLVSDAHRRANGEAVQVEVPDTSVSVWWWVLSLVLAIALGAAATVWFMNTKNDPASEHSPVAAIDHIDTRLKPEPVGSETLAEASPAELSPALMSLYDRAIAERASLTEQPVKPEGRASSSPLDSNTTQASSQPELIASAKAMPKSEAIDEEELFARTQSLLAASQRDAVLDSSLPTLELLSEEVRDNVPTLLYSAHDYRPQGVSKVMINREWWTQGQDIRGVKVIEIREKSTILESQDGTRFIQPALNSWVNL